MASYKKIKTIDDELMRLRVSDRLLALRRQLGGGDTCENRNGHAPSRHMEHTRVR